MADLYTFDGEQKRLMTDDEQAAYKIVQNELAAQKKAIKDRKDARQAVLDKLGLTADEAEALFG